MIIKIKNSEGNKINKQDGKFLRGEVGGRFPVPVSKCPYRFRSTDFNEMSIVKVNLFTFYLNNHDSRLWIRESK